MDILRGIAFPGRSIFHRALSLTAAAALLVAASAAFADDPTTMAPPVEISAPEANGGNAGADSVFNWQEIPANQQVPITRACFDQGGYQLYDTVGETIVVPFTNQNLYVMKFAQSGNGKMYFVNEGGYPVLYVPNNGYLENATVAGARWFPFGEKFHPSHPVFLGIAPSWSVFVGMGWYPHMACYGGYWSRDSFIEGGIFLPSVGLFFEIGSRPYYGWDGYHRYAFAHPAPYRIAYYDRNFYHVGYDRWGDRPRQFEGAGHAFYAHRTFQGARDYSNEHGFQGEHSYGGDHSYGGGHTFRGGSATEQSDHRYSGRSDYGGSHSYSGASHSHEGGVHSDGGRYGGGDHHFRG